MNSKIAALETQIKETAEKQNEVDRKLKYERSSFLSPRFYIPICCAQTHLLSSIVNTPIKCPHLPSSLALFPIPLS